LKYVKVRIPNHLYRGPRARRRRVSMTIPEKTRIFNTNILGVDLPVREAEDATFLFRAANPADALSYPNLSQMISGVPAGQNVGILEYVRSGNGTNAEREVTYLAE